MAGETALLVPVEGPVEVITLDGTLEQLQGLVGGYIEAIPLPEFVDPDGRATSYANEEGKYRSDCLVNTRGTDFLVPGVGLFWGDHVAGPLLICGFDPRTGEHAELPAGVEQRVRLIEREAA